MAVTVTDLANALRAHRGLNDEERQFFVELGLVMRVILDPELQRLATVERELAQRK